MAKIVFILCEETMRSAKSGFYIEGTDIAMDFPSDYPIPLETEVIENGSPVALRLLPNCGFLEKDRQIEKGFPPVYHWQDNDRDRVNFRYGRLELDDGRDKIWVEYLVRSGWLKGNEEKKARPNQKTIFERYEEDKVLQTDLDLEELIVTAKKMIFAGDEASIRNLYRLAAGGQMVDKNLSVLNMKKSLLEVANVNPKFIINGVRSEKDKVIVLLTKAMELKIISLDFPEAVAIYSPADKDWMGLINVSDEMGRENKFDKAVDYLLTEKGKIELSIIENQVGEKESELKKEDGPQPKDDAQPEPKTKRR